MCVLLVALASIMPLFAVGTRSHKRGVDQTVASFAAPQIVAQLQENLTTDRPQEIKNAEIVFQGMTYRYDATFQPFDGRDLAQTAYLVRVTIKWGAGANEDWEQFDTVLLRRVRR